jgi:predicted GIY-YIG superfamily endonuclease
MHTVYLINQEGTDLYKIGVTKNLSKRLSALQTSSPVKLVVVKQFNTNYGYKLEKNLHSFFRSNKLEGEWFRLDIQQVNLFEECCNKAETNFNYLKEHNTYVQFL